MWIARSVLLAGVAVGPRHSQILEDHAGLEVLPGSDGLRADLAEHFEGLAKVTGRPRCSNCTIRSCPWRRYGAFTGHNPTEYLQMRRRFRAEKPDHALDRGPLPTD